MNNFPKILLDVKKIFHSETGEIEEIDFCQSIPLLYEYNLFKPIKGETQIINLGEEVLANIGAAAFIKLDCARCAKEFSYKANLKFKQSYKLNPLDDDFSISKDFKIDLWPAIRQEILLNIPMKPLCNKKCKIKL